LIESLDALIAKKRDLKQATMQLLLTGKKRLNGFSNDVKLQSMKHLVDFANGKPMEPNIAANGRYDLITLDSIGINGRLKKSHRKVSHYDGSLSKGDIVAVLSDLAHGNLLALSDVIPSDDRYVLNQRMARLRLKCAKNSPEYIRLQLNRNQKHFKNRGQGTSQRHIYKRDFYSLCIPLPDPREQSAIAEVLSDMDAEIDALIARRDKTKLLKTGLMQELLSGRRRLV
jgi:type I restriction enzyme S subunit